MRSKQSNSEHLVRDLLSGKISITDILNKIKFVLTPDKGDAPLLEADEYMKKYEPRQVQIVERKRKKPVEKLPEPVFVPEQKWTKIGSIDNYGNITNFSTGTDNWSDIRSRMAQQIRELTGENIR